MEQRIRKMYAQDLVTVGVFLIFMWLVFAFVLRNLVPIVHGIYGVVSVIAASLGVGLLATMTLLAVASHLKRHKTELYSEEISNSQI